MIRASNGSSPLARGTVQYFCVALLVLRFIPAGAGNRMPAWPDRNRLTVHPRWRGEQTGCQSQITERRGSSPLARGTGCGCGGHSPSNAVHPRWRGEQAYVEDMRAVVFRFIPAGAGNRMNKGTA